MNPNDELAALFHDRLRGNKFDLVRFVDELLLFAGAVCEIHCAPAGEDRLRFAVASESPFEIDLERAMGKLRMICARLAVLCGGPPASLYGGEGTIAVDVNADSKNGDKSTDQVVLQVHFDNKPGKVWFTLRGEKRSAKVVREPERVRA